MKKKLYLDVILLVIMLLLMNYNFTGGFLHEFLGIAIFILFIWHNVKNFKWITAITKNIMKGKVNSKILTNYIVDVILWISLILVTISGIFISKSLFVFISISNQDIWYLIHLYSAYIFLGIIFLHVILHGKMISNFIEKNYNVENKRSMKFVLLFIFFFVIFIGFRSLFNKINAKADTTSNTNTTSYSSSTSDSSDESYTNPSSSDDEDSSYSTPSSGNTPTLAEYLSQRNCSNCHKHCVLNALGCGKGQSAKTEATNEYYETYGN